MIRLTSRVVTVLDQVYQLRYLLAAILALGVLAGLGLGSYLALSLERPIKRVADSIQELAAGSRQLQVEEQGPQEIRSLAHSFNVLVVQLNSLEQARRQLLANLVHELGRPLGAIRSAIQALVNGAMDDPQLSADLLTGLDGETLRLQRLLEDLAGLHDQVLGTLELNRTPVQLQDWLPEIASPWEAAAREKGLAWTLEIEPDLPEIEVDPDRLAQALGNLLSNAVKFTPSGGQVAVSVRRIENELLLEVVDFGSRHPRERAGEGLPALLPRLAGPPHRAGHGSRPQHRPPGRRGARRQPGSGKPASQGQPFQVEITSTNPSAPQPVQLWSTRQVVIATLMVVSILASFLLIYRFSRVFLIFFIAVVLSTAIRPVVNWLNQRGCRDLQE